MKKIVFALLIFFLYINSFAAPLGSAPPKEPKPYIPNISTPDEPQPKGGIPLDDLNIKEPYPPVETTPRDKDIFKKYEKEPDIPLYEPSLRFRDPYAKEPEPLIILPDGEFYFVCPKYMKCE